MAATQDEGTLARIKHGDKNVINDIISVFKQEPTFKPNGNSVTGFRYPKRNSVAYVKFGPLKQIATEVQNHEYAFGALKKMPPNQTRGIRIPEIYHTFNVGEELNQKMFIIMEYIDGKTLAELVEEHGYETTKKTHEGSIARAIRLLMSIKAPKDQGPGPVGGGRIRHPLFKNETSYLAYSSVDALEKYLNQVSTCRNKAAPTVHLKEEKLCFYYSDFFEGNFIFTDSGEICLIDFDKAGFLPQSFMIYALAESHWDPGRWIKNNIMLSLREDELKAVEKNLEAMRNIFSWLAIGCRVGVPQPKRLWLE
ncbi:hypothetical protein N8I77_013403 [Diaporthe amygdali]|uniref:Aminoglycoside phosphotransferase domain-containing protein n=1 Tax=Phomopsis amygdali TaxID=1214568 RepID=A0AAD9S2Q9_PHOAM|nr:hypothetical protein N8I77_013403 [Diaporthe amygdali]